MGKASRDKGNRGEREFVKALGEELGEVLTRRLGQARDSGSDVHVVGWSIEVKRAAKAELGAWWAQAVDRAADVGLKPALAYRLDRRSWRVRLPLSFLGIAGDGPDWTLEVTVAGFAALLRERCHALELESELLREGI